MVTTSKRHSCASERALLRSPIVIDDSVIANTNEESTVVSIDDDEYLWRVPKRGDAAGWEVSHPGMADATASG